MRIKDFPFERFLEYKEKKDADFLEFINNGFDHTPIVSPPDSFHWTGICRDKALSLESQLDYLFENMRTESDFAYNYIEPWYGVGVFASAYGCKYEFTGNDSPQTRSVFNTLDDLDGIKKPFVKDCEVMMHILEMIKYFKEQTGGCLDISLTDTQSANDSASLVLDHTEMLIASMLEPERLEPFLNQITELIIEFTDMQIDAIGDSLSRPGHAMLGNRKLTGIAIADDNMIALSPKTYEDTSYKFNKRLSEYYGGISIHSCGNASANLKKLSETPNLFMVDLALGHVVDPSPNPQDAVIEAFKGTDTIVKVKAGDHELEKIGLLLKSDVKIIVELRINDAASTEERNERFFAAKEKVELLKK